MAQGTPLPYGLRDIKITSFTTLAATAYAASSIDFPNARTLVFTEVEEFNDLRGDDRLVTSHGSGPNIEWELEGGGLSFEIVRAMYGGAILETGVTPNQVKRLRKLVSDVRPPFKLEGQIISDSGGDVHAILYRCKATDNLSGTFGDGEFFLTSASGKGYASTVPADLDTVWDLVQNETAVAIP
jgi:hypothetical protein